MPSIYLVDGKTGRVLHKILGDDDEALGGMKKMLADEVSKIIAAEEAAKAAEAAKKAEEAAKKAEEEKKTAEAAQAVESPGTAGPTK